MPQYLLDITGIKDLNTIRELKNGLKIGANTTLSDIAASSLVAGRYSVLSQAAGQVAVPQIRNMGTLVGNIVNAMPAADGVVAVGGPVLDGTRGLLLARGDVVEFLGVEAAVLAAKLTVYPNRNRAALAGTGTGNQSRNAENKIADNVNKTYGVLNT
jgi:hypothetical protein